MISNKTHLEKKKKNELALKIILILNTSNNILDF